MSRFFSVYQKPRGAARGFPKGGFFVRELWFVNRWFVPRFFASVREAPALRRFVPRSLGPEAPTLLQRCAALSSKLAFTDRMFFTLCHG